MCGYMLVSLLAACSSEGCTNCTADVNKCSDCKSGYKLNNTECIRKYFSSKLSVMCYEYVGLDL